MKARFSFLKMIRIVKTPKPKIGILQIKDIQCHVTHAYFQEERAGEEHTKWLVSIPARLGKFPHKTWFPRLYAESVHLKAPTIRDLAGKRFYIPDGYNENKNTPNFSLHVVDDYPTRENEIYFPELKGDEIRIEWEGIADINYNDKYSQNVPFFLNTWLEFDE